MSKETAKLPDWPFFDNAPAILEFSGGKDSLALMYLYRTKNIRAHFCDTGGTFPHIMQFVKETCKTLNVPLEIIQPVIPVRTYHENFGLPSDIVPGAFYPQEVGETLIQSLFQCCNAMRWKPMREAILKSGVKVVINGQRKLDRAPGITKGLETDAKGITYFRPLWEWKDEDVFKFLKEQGASLPEQYKMVNSSMDCWLCTAHLASDEAVDELKYIKENYPNLWPELVERTRRVKEAVESEQNLIAPALKAILG